MTSLGQGTPAERTTATWSADDSFCTSSRSPRIVAATAAASAAPSAATEDSRKRSPMAAAAFAADDAFAATAVAAAAATPSKPSKATRERRGRLVTGPSCADDKAAPKQTSDDKSPAPSFVPPPPLPLSRLVAGAGSRERR